MSRALLAVVDQTTVGGTRWSVVPCRRWCVGGSGPNPRGMSQAAEPDMPSPKAGRWANCTSSVRISGVPLDRLLSDPARVDLGGFRILRPYPLAMSEERRTKQPNFLYGTSNAACDLKQGSAREDTK